MRKGLFALLPACSPLTGTQWEKVYTAENAIYEMQPLLAASSDHNFGVDHSYEDSMNLAVEHLGYIISERNIINGTCPDGKAAWYNAATDKIHMCEWDNDLASVLMHEVGHEYWMHKHQGRGWDTIFDTQDFPYLNGNMTEYAGHVLTRAKSMQDNGMLGDNYCIDTAEKIPLAADFLVDMSDKKNWVNKRNVAHMVWLHNAGMLHPCD